MEHHRTSQEYLSSLTEPAKSWMTEFIGHMETKYPFIPLTMHEELPTFKFDNTYIAFSAGENGFTLHTLDFYEIEELKTSFLKGKYEKGSITVPYEDEESKTTLYYLIQKIIFEHIDTNMEGGIFDTAD